MKNKLGWSVVWEGIKRFVSRDWIPEHAKQNARDAMLASKPKRDPKAPYYRDPVTPNEKDSSQTVIGHQASLILQEAIARSFEYNLGINPPLTIDGKPNEAWITFQGYAYPDLTRAEIEAKHLTAIAEEEYIITTFLNGEEPKVTDHPRPNPQVKHDDGQMFIKLFNEWYIYSPGVMHRH